MKKYKVHLQKIVDVYIEVEAEDKESAIEEAYDYAYLDGYVGNGGTGDKLIGTRESNVSIGCDCEPLEGSYELEINAEEIKD